MQVLKEQTGKGTATIEIKINKADYEKDVNNALKDYQRKAAVPGFRAGKVPLGMVKKMYGNSIIADQINKLVSSTLNNHIIENELNVLGYPLADAERTGTIDFDTNEEFSFFFDVAMAPEFEVNISDLTVNYPKVKASEKEINETVEKLLKDYPEVTSPEFVSEGDKIELRITEADEKEAEVDNGYSTNVKVAVDDFVDADVKNMFVGKELGSEFVVNLQKGLGDAEKVIKLLKLTEEQSYLAASNFNVIIDEIEHTEPSEMNESFFNRIFPNDEIATSEAFKERIGTEIGRQLEQQSDYYVYSLGLKNLIDGTDFELPKEFMKRWLVDNSEGKLSASEIDENYADYERSLRFQLIEDKLVQQHPELKVDQQEVRKFVMSYFFGQFPAEMEIDENMEKSLSSTVDSILKNKKEEQRIVQQLRERKLIQLFKNKLNLVEQEMNADEFKALVADNNGEHSHE